MKNTRKKSAKQPRYVITYNDSRLPIYAHKLDWSLENEQALIKSIYDTVDMKYVWSPPVEEKKPRLTNQLEIF